MPTALPRQLVQRAVEDPGEARTLSSVVHMRTCPKRLLLKKISCIPLHGRLRLQGQKRSRYRLVRFDPRNLAKCSTAWLRGDFARFEEGSTRHMHSKALVYPRTICLVSFIREPGSSTGLCRISLRTMNDRLRGEHQTAERCGKISLQAWQGF